MKNYLIFSACSDIGLEMAKILSKKGRVIMEARNEEKLKNKANELGLDYITCDITNFDDTERVFERVMEKFGKIDGVACLAGSILLKPAHLTSKEDLMVVLNSNLFPAFSVVRSCGKFLKDASVVLFSSAVYDLGLANHEAISCAKGAVASLVKSASASYASKNIRFNAVAPGMTETKLTERILKSEAGRAASISMHPLGRVGSAFEIASLASFLLSDEASFITGQTIKIDGGLASLKLPCKN